MAKVNLSEEARKAGLPANVVISRVNKLGWSVEKAVSTPVRQKVKPSKPVREARETTTATPSKRSPGFEATVTESIIEDLQAALKHQKRKCKIAGFASAMVIACVIAWAFA
mgnify:CR=1 FL=1